MASVKKFLVYGNVTKKEFFDEKTDIFSKCGLDCRDCRACRRCAG
jgi:hypothetical protein